MAKLGVSTGYRHCLKHLSVPRKTKPKVFLKNSKTHVPPGNLASVTGARGRGAERLTVPFRPACDRGPERTGPPEGSLLKGKACVLADERLSRLPVPADQHYHG